MSSKFYFIQSHRYLSKTLYTFSTYYSRFYLINKTINKIKFIDSVTFYSLSNNPKTIDTSFKELLPAPQDEPVKTLTINEFFEAYDNQQGCLILDVRMPGMDGLALQQKLKTLLSQLPIIFISGHGDIPMAVEAVRHGALDFLRKPIKQDVLLTRIEEAYQRVIEQQQNSAELGQHIEKYQSLTKREREVFECVCEGASNKSIASDLSISERTVEVHRSNVMQKLSVNNLPEMVRVKVLLDQAAGK